MRSIQPPSKLQLLESQRRPRRRMPGVVVSLVLAAVTAWNVRVIAHRYFGDAEGPAVAQAALLPTAEAKTVPVSAEDAPPAVVPAQAAPLAEVTDDAEADAVTEQTPARDVSDVPVSPPDPDGQAHLDAYAAAAEAATEAVETEEAVAAPAPVEATSLVGAGEAVAFHTVTGRLARNRTVAEALDDAGLTGEQIYEVVQSLKGVFDFRKARPGQGFRVKLTPEGQVAFFEFETSPVESFCARREDGALTGYRREIPVETRLAVVQGTIESSLYESMSRVGEDPTLAVLLADVLAWDIDFYRDTRPGDAFDIVVEKRTYKGKLLGYGEVVAAQYKGGVGTYQVFRHEKADGTVAYYDAEGKSAQKALLKAPLKVARITSRYGSRRHPVLGYTKMHRGVDYGAPTGTPVWAVGDGTVIWAGWKGANGNLVGIRHANGYTSWYAHLSRIHVRSGQRVHQKQVIARVGSTGRSTGPHLHYGLKRNGSHVNPLRLKLPPRQPLPASELAEYHERIAPYVALFEQGDASLVASLPPPAPTDG